MISLSSLTHTQDHPQPPTSRSPFEYLFKKVQFFSFSSLFFLRVVMLPGCCNIPLSIFNLFNSDYIFFSPRRQVHSMPVSPFYTEWKSWHVSRKKERKWWESINHSVAGNSKVNFWPNGRQHSGQVNHIVARIKSVVRNGANAWRAGDDQCEGWKNFFHRNQ